MRCKTVSVVKKRLHAAAGNKKMEVVCDAEGAMVVARGEQSQQRERERE